MFSQKIIERDIERWQAIPGNFVLERHNAIECERAVSHFEALIEPYDGSKIPDVFTFYAGGRECISRRDPTKDWRLSLNKQEARWIRNERALCRFDFLYWVERYCWIKNEEDRVVRMVPWTSQLILLDIFSEMQAEQVAIMLILLKARQLGLSREITLIMLHDVVFIANINAFLASCTEDKTGLLFDMLDFVLERLPFWMQPGEKFRRENKFLELLNGSALTLQHGQQSTGIARGTTPTKAHISELAEFDEGKVSDLIDSSLLRAMHDSPNTFLVLEGTAKGMNNWWHRKWEASKNGWPEHRSRLRPLFLPWFVGGLYPKNDWLRAHPVPDDYMSRALPWAVTHAGAAAEYVRKTDYLRKRLGESWEMPVEQIWYYECERDAALRENRLNRFLQEMPACISGDIRVSTKRGIVPIREAVEYQRQLTDGNTTAWMAKGEREVLTIRTKAGRVLGCTPDHRVAVPDGWKPASELAAGDIITLSPPSFSRTYFAQQWDWLPCCRMSLDVDENVGRFLGYFMGDGCFSDDTVDIACSGIDRDVVDDATRLMQQLAGTNIGIEERGGLTVVSSSSVRWKEILKAMGCVQPRMHSSSSGRSHQSSGHRRKVCVPECIWRSPEPVVRQFLSALFECDGHAYPNWSRITFATKYEEFARDVQLLLLGFGINSAITSQTVTRDGHNYVTYSIGLGAFAARLFHQSIGFISERKRGAEPPGEVGKNAKPNLMVDVVIGVESAGMTDVYDLTVDSSHSFGAGGILVHNCDDEAFQSTNISVFDTETITFYRDQAHSEPLAGCYGLRGSPEIVNPRLQPSDLLVDPDEQPIDIAVEKATGYPIRLSLVPLRFDGWSLETGLDKIYIWEHPEPGQTYGFGFDTADGIGKDRTVLEGVRKNSIDGPLKQVCEYASDKMSALDGWPLLLALGTYYSVPDIRGQVQQPRMAIECKGQGDLPQNIIRMMGWSNFHPWNDKQLDARAPKLSQYNKIGVYTASGWFRDGMISLLIKTLRDADIEICSKFFVQEMSSLEGDEAVQSLRAGYGGHDDRIMALGFILVSLLKWDAEYYRSAKIAAYSGKTPVGKAKAPKHYPRWIEGWQSRTDQGIYMP